MNNLHIIYRYIFSGKTWVKSELDKKFSPLDFPLIANNPNEPEVSKIDKFEAMKDLATK